MSEVLFIVGMVACLILPFSFMTGEGRRQWLITMGIIGTVLVGMEFYSVGVTGGTISQHFWHWSVKHVGTAWLVIGLLFLGWMLLLLHLAWKLLFDKNYNKKFKK